MVEATFNMFDALSTWSEELPRWQHLLEKACGSLRRAYQYLIQKELFNVVRRWRENMAFTLDKVFFDEGIAGRVHNRMVALSRYIDAHSHSPDFHEVPLTLEVLSSELAQFDSIKSGLQQGSQGMGEGQAQSCERLQLTYLFRRA